MIWTNEKIKLFNADCFDIFPQIADKSVDLILCDLPYGVLGHKWDSRIPLDKLWEQYKRIIKDNGAIVLTGTQPFTSLVISSNLEMFKYNWIWDKGKPGNIYTAKLRPMQLHEDIMVFSFGTVANCSNRLMKYNPQMIPMSKPDTYKMYKQGESFKRDGVKSIKYSRDKKYPQTIIKISNNDQRSKTHPTQKPVALMEYLIKTYTNEGDLVLDNTFGSGTTAVACQNLNRQFVGMEKEKKYFDIAVQRLTA